jgi:hypothetical protein
MDFSSKPSRSDDVHMHCFLDAIFISHSWTGHRASVPNKPDEESAVFRTTCYQHPNWNSCPRNTHACTAIIHYLIHGSIRSDFL